MAGFDASPVSTRWHGNLNAGAGFRQASVRQSPLPRQNADRRGPHSVEQFTASYDLPPRISVANAQERWLRWFRSFDAESSLNGLPAGGRKRDAGSRLVRKVALVSQSPSEGL